MPSRNKTLEASLLESIKRDAKQYREEGKYPTHCLMHPETWIAVARESTTLPRPEKEKAEEGKPYKLGYHYTLYPSQRYNGGHGALTCYPAEDIAWGAALICDAATASLYIDELLSEEERS